MGNNFISDILDGGMVKDFLGNQDSFLNDRGELSLTRVLFPDFRKQKQKEQREMQKARDFETQAAIYNQVMGMLGNNPTLEQQRGALGRFDQRLAQVDPTLLQFRTDPTQLDELNEQIAKRDEARQAFQEKVGVDPRIANIQTMENLRAAGQSRIQHLSQAKEQRETTRISQSRAHKFTMTEISARHANAKDLVTLRAGTKGEKKAARLATAAGLRGAARAGAQNGAWGIDQTEKPDGGTTFRRAPQSPAQIGAANNAARRATQLGRENNLSEDQTALVAQGLGAVYSGRPIASVAEASTEKDARWYLPESWEDTVLTDEGRAQVPGIVRTGLATVELLNSLQEPNVPTAKEYRKGVMDELLALGLSRQEAAELVAAGSTIGE